MRGFRMRVMCVLVLAAGTAPAARLAAQTLLTNVPDSAVLASLRFRSIGPAIMSGRISDIAVPPVLRPGERHGKTFYVASAAGGVWKTTNAGMSFTPIFDDQRVSSIGAVAVAPSNPNIVWVGTGESNNLRSSSWGEGVYRSNDGGMTWTHAGLRGSQHVARIVVHPSNPDVVFVAAMGPLWGSGGERGFYRTTDGGNTWRATLTAGPFTGVTDIVLDPRDPDVIYAATYQRERKAYSFVAGGPESGIWKSTDGGETWRPLTQGLPAGDRGRIGIDVARSQPNTLYATVHASDGGIFRSDDAGETWTRTSTLQSIPWFFGQIRVDPQDAERVYHLGVQLQVSDDGGRTFRAIAQRTHADHHAMWIDPMDSDHLIIGNDGGLFISHDRGRTFDFAINLPVSTFYTIAYDMREPYWIYGGLQDNGTWAGPSRTFARSGPGNSEWVRAGGGDGFYAAIDPTNHNIAFVESQNGALQRWDFSTHERKSIRPPVQPGDPPVRYNWSAPLLISPHDNRTLWFAANVLYRSTDHGDTWERVSGDLTRALNRDTLPIMGLSAAGGFGRHDGVAPFGNIATLDESPLRPGLVYVGTDDGLVQVTRDGGRTWTRIDSFPGVPDLTYVSRVVASAHDEATVYVTFDGHRDNDFRPYVLKSTDYGASFTSIAANLPQDGSVYVIREHPRNRELLFVGTEYGVFVTVNGGRSWAQLRNGMAPAPVHDLAIHPRDNDLIAATHGRGIFVMDDVGPLEQLANLGRLVAGLVSPRPATVYNPRTGPATVGDRFYTTPNAPGGAVIHYFIGANVPRNATASVAIRSADGELVNELPARVEPGLHRVLWDLRWMSAAAATAAADADGDAPQQQQGPQAPPGPYVAPGGYTVELRLSQLPRNAAVAGDARIEVRADPELSLEPAQLDELYDARLRAHRAHVQAQQLVARLEEAKNRVDGAVAGRTENAPGAAAARAYAAELERALDALRPVRRPGPQGAGQGCVNGVADSSQPLLLRVSCVAGAIATVHFPPTAPQRGMIDDAERQLPGERERVDALLARLPDVLRPLGAR